MKDNKKFLASLSLLFFPVLVLSLTYGIGVDAEESSDKLNVICGVNYVSVPVGQKVTWSAKAQGGGGRYNYTWSGTEGLSGDGSSVSKKYEGVGTKAAQVKVVARNEERTVNCSNHVSVRAPVNSGYCSVQVSHKKEGYQIRWDSRLSKTNSSTTYQWSGTENLTSSQEDNKDRSISKIYTTNGLKTGTALITAPLEMAVLDCSATVNRPTVTENTKPLGGKCIPSVSNMKVTWRTSATGGSREKTYSWSGTDGLSGSAKSIKKEYTTPGVKDGDVTITSGNQTLKLHCEAKVAPKDLSIKVN